jgi:ribosomal protein L12E/L44/L45/RPP1/RPP2
LGPPLFGKLFSQLSVRELRLLAEHLGVNVEQARLAADIKKLLKPELDRRENTHALSRDFEALYTKAAKGRATAAAAEAAAGRQHRDDEEEGADEAARAGIDRDGDPPPSPRPPPSEGGSGHVQPGADERQSLAGDLHGDRRDQRSGHASSRASSQREEAAEQRSRRRRQGSRDSSGSRQGRSREARSPARVRRRRASGGDTSYDRWLSNMANAHRAELPADHQAEYDAQIRRLRERFVGLDRGIRQQEHGIAENVEQSAGE